MPRSRKELKLNPTCIACSEPLNNQNWGKSKQENHSYLCLKCESARQVKWQRSDPIRTRTIQKRSARRGGRYSKLSAIAKRRGLSFLLTKEQCKEIWSRKCYYCDGSLPETGAGMDRLNNDIGYELINVVPCCTADNVMRNTHLDPFETAWLRISLRNPILLDAFCDDLKKLTIRKAS